MIIVTEDQLTAVLKDINGAAIISIVAQTDARLLKTDNPFAMPVTKRSHINGIINWSYSNSVNNQRCREEQPIGADGEVEQFVAKPRRWGTRMAGLPFVEHTNKQEQYKQYLEVKVERSLAHQYFDANGNTLTDEQVAPFLPKKSKPKTQKTDKEIFCRDYTMSNVQTVQLNRYRSKSQGGWVDGGQFVVDGKGLLVA